MASKHILVVDDEIGIRELLRDILQDEGYQVVLAENAAAARAIRMHERPDAVLLDIWMPDCDGITLLKEWSAGGLLTMPVVMMSGHGTIDTAVEATRIGAFDFLEKPIALQKLLKTVATALKHSELLPKSEMSLASLGKSSIAQTLKERLEKIANHASTQPVLLIEPKGGSGELCARFLHRPSTPWLVLSDVSQLAYTPLDLLESLVDGLLYIPEVARLNKTEQKGLQLLMTKADQYNVRVVCATSENLPKLQAENLFDHTLLQTLSTISLRVPALDEHKEDVPDLVVAIANMHFEVANIPYCEFDIAALNALRNAHWPGDMAQLETIVLNLIQTSLGEKVTLDDVNRVLHLFANEVQLIPIEKATDTTAPPAVGFNMPLREARDEFERSYFMHHIQNVNGNMSKLAEISGLERTHLYRKLKQLDIKTKN